MKGICVAGLVVLLAVPLHLHAQDSPVGKYSGTFTVPTLTGDRQIGLELTIASVEGGKVKGAARSYSRSCGGDFPVEGTYEGSKLEIRSTAKFGPAGDCSFRMRLTVEGNKLVGETGGGRPIQLSK